MPTFITAPGLMHFYTTMKKFITSILLIIAATAQVWGVVYSTELQRAAEAGDMVSQYKLAHCYHHGNGIDVDMITAAYWYKKAADQGDMYSQSALGDLYYLGEGVGKDDKAALQWWNKAAKSGYWGGAYSIGYYYLKAKDYKHAIEWFNYSNEISRKNMKYPILANFELGLCYYSNWQGQDYAKAFNLFSQEVEENNNFARAKLGEMYMRGQLVAQDYDKAFKLLKEAAENEIQPSGDAMNLLSSCYRFGLGTAKDINKADYWLNKSKETSSDLVVLIMQALSEK